MPTHPVQTETATCISSPSPPLSLSSCYIVLTPHIIRTNTPPLPMAFSDTFTPNHVRNLEDCRIQALDHATNRPGSVVLFYTPNPSST